MSRPTISRRSIRLVRFRLRVLVGLSIGAAGCAPVVRPAPFQGSATRVTGVSLLGPYDGQIIDNETGEPITDAAIVAVWTYEQGDGLTGPDGSTTREVETDEAGRYRIPRPEQHRQGRHRVLTNFTLFVYKRGYAAYRSDIHVDGSARVDFTMRHNEVRLQKWSPRDSHADQLASLAGPRQIQQASAWERVLANAELLRRQDGLPAPEASPTASPERSLDEETRDAPAPTTRARLLDAASVLPVDEVQRRTGDDGALVVRDLSDTLARTSYYHGVSLQAEGRAAGYDLSYRVWVSPPDGMQPIRATFEATLPGVRVSDEITEQTWIYEDAGVRVVAFIDNDASTAVLVSCGVDQCADIETAILLAGLARRNAADLAANREEVRP